MMIIRPVRVTINRKSPAYRLGYRLGGCLADALIYGLIFWLVVYLIARFFFDF